MSVVVQRLPTEAQPCLIQGALDVEKQCERLVAKLMSQVLD